MKNKLKRILSGISLWIMFITILITVILGIVYIFSETFNLRVFDEKTTVFLGIFSIAIIIINVLLAVFTISLNISIIADDKIETSMTLDIPQKKKIIVIVTSVIIALSLFLIGGNLLTVYLEKKRLIHEAGYIIENQKNTIESITSLIISNKYQEISQLLKYISSQNKEYPFISIILKKKFINQDTFIYIDSNYDDKKRIDYDKRFYSSNKKEYQYFKSVLIDKTVRDIMYLDEDNTVNVYIPITEKADYIMIFHKRKRGFGFIGS